VYVRLARAGGAGAVPVRSLGFVRAAGRPMRRGGLGQYSTSQIQALITQYANQYGVNPALALAIAQQESSFNPAAVSAPNKNGSVDYGLMQINSSNLASLGLTPATALDPDANVQAAMKLLAGYTSQYGGDPSLIAAAYNEGPGNVAAGLPDTAYVNSILSNMTLFGSGAGDSLASPADLGGDLSNILNTGSVDLSSLFDTSAGSDGDGSSLLPWLIGGAVLAGLVWAVSS